MSTTTHGTATLHHGDCLDVLATIPDASIDAVVTDPPYGLEFMGKGWDAPWRESGVNADAGMSATGYADGAWRLPRPSFTGSTNPKCLSCKGTRRGRRDGTAKVAVCLCADGGRFPNVRAIEMRAFQDWCAQWTVECLRVLKPGGHAAIFGGSRTWHRLATAVEDAGFEVRDSVAWLYGSGFPKSRNLDGDWEGWGTALKPAFEPIVLARKPLAGTVAANVLTHGTGALNIDACRTEGRERTDYGLASARRSRGATYGEPSAAADFDSSKGRWPTNVVLDGHQADELDRQSGSSTSRVGNPRGADSGDGWGMTATGAEYDDHGGASRFFPVFRYAAKAGTDERPRVDGIAHPTVKPLDLMRWLVRLITPPGGTVLDPFAGSGTTLEAALLEGHPAVGIEREGDYLPLIAARLNRRRDPVAYLTGQGDDLGLFDLDQEDAS